MASMDSPDRPAVLKGKPIPGANAGSMFHPSTASSGSGHRHPARSFVSQSPMTNGDHAQYASEGVREQTAELASYTFAKSAVRSDSSAAPSPPLAAKPSHNRSHSDATYDSQPSAIIRPRTDSPSSQVPETIEERSEPVTPNESDSSDYPSPNRNEPSALSSMFRKLSNYGAISKQRQSKDDERQQNGNKRVPDIIVGEAVGGSDEQRPLLGKSHTGAAAKSKLSGDQDGRKPSAFGDVEDQKPFRRKRGQFSQIIHLTQHKGSNFLSVARNPKQWDKRAIWEQGIKKPVSLIPCVFLGLLLNVLDALSYGMILFPLGEPIFADTGADGISMFYVSCIVAQLTYSCGGSIFKGAVGSEMIEVVPFFHKMVYTIMQRTGQANPHAVMATTITAFAASSVLTGLVFFLLGIFKLGSLVSFFPRHILIGCVGGVGFFLFVTGIEVSARLDGNLEYNLHTAKALMQKDTVPLWTTPLGLSIALLILLRFTNSPYVVPGFFIATAVIFYIVVAAVASFNVQLARDNGWVFAAPAAGVPFYNFYSYYDFAAVDWKAFAACIPSMFALTFFGVLHVPINIPALAIAAEEDDLNLNRELVAHGFSNAISGFVGSIQNYLVYVNSQMFIQNGGNSRLAGLFLAAATFGVWVAGPAMIGYVPVMVVGALIFYLGIELLEEALWDTWGKMAKLEYLTVVIIVLVMGVYDFVAGILVGIVLACLSFVLQTSQKSAIRATYSGEVVVSTVRRHPIQRHFLHEVGHQIYVTKLAGFLFFGSIVSVEKQSRALIEEEAFNQDPIRYLVFDLTHVDGIDFSAAEAFSRMERVLARRDVRMIVSGVSKESDMGRSLRSVGLWTDDSAVRFFQTLNDALEFCENELLKTLYAHEEASNSVESTRPASLDIPKPEFHNNNSSAQASPGAIDMNMSSSPRQRFLQEAATTTLSSHASPPQKRYSSLKQPLPLLLQTFQELSAHTEDFWFHALPYFTRQEHPRGTVLFSRGQAPEAFYLLESGILHANYTLPMGHYQESIVAGTTCGELPFFSETSRTATVVAEKDCVTWCLKKDDWEKMQQEWPDGARELLRVAMKLTKERFDGVVSYVLTAAG